MTPRQVRGTRLAWSSVGEWCDLVEREGGRIVAASPHYARLARLFRSLTAADLRACDDAAALERFARLVGREGRGRLFHGPEREISRPELGAMVVEARNRIRRLEAIAAGRPDRAAGPRFDPTRIPDDRLAALIQRHADMGIVEQLRAERARRATV